MSEITFKCVQNNDVELTFTVTRLDGTLINLTGSTIKFSVYDQCSDVVKFSKTTVSGISLTDPTNGVFVVYIDKEDIAGFTGTFIYDIVITDALGNVANVTDEDNNTGYIIIRKQYAIP